MRCQSGPADLRRQSHVDKIKGHVYCTLFKRFGVCTSDSDRQCMERQGQPEPKLEKRDIETTEWRMSSVDTRNGSWPQTCVFHGWNKESASTTLCFDYQKRNTSGWHCSEIASFDLDNVHVVGGESVSSPGTTKAKVGRWERYIC